MRGGGDVSPATDPVIDSAYDRCERTAREHARNFYYAFRTLPRERRRAIYAAYAFCRVCDDIADGDLPTDDRRRGLSELRSRLGSALDGDRTDPVLTAVAHASSRFGISPGHLGEVIDGVEMDLSKARYADFEELRGYCYKVASVVGLISIEIFGYSDPAARRHAVDLGLAMQLTNIMRDVREDFARDRVYLPQDEMSAFGYGESDLRAGVVDERFRGLMALQAKRARAYFESGSRLLPLLRPESRACPAVLGALYSAILDRIEASGFDVFGRRIGLSLPEKLVLMTRFWAAGAARGLLRRGT